MRKSRLAVALISCITILTLIPFNHAIADGTYSVSGIKIVDNSSGSSAGFLASGNSYQTGRTHLGIDITARIGAPVYAIANGTVIEAAMKNGYGGDGSSRGGAILIRHNNMNGEDFYAVYGHISYLVSNGQKVTQGQQIATVAPWDNGSHLHLGISTKLQSNPWQGFISTENALAPDGWVDPIGYITSFLNVVTSSGTTLGENIPTLKSPSDGVTIQKGISTTFSWSNTGVSRYKIRFFNDSGFDTTDINVNGTSISFTPNYLGNWSWKVCEFPDTGKEGPYSSERNFIVPQTQSQQLAPTLNNPSNNVTITAGTTTAFSWSNTGATRYKIRFINNSGAGTTDINVNSTSYNFTPNYDGNWTWKVCEFPDTGKEGPYSSERSFVVYQTQSQSIEEANLKQDTISSQQYDSDSGTFMFALREPGNYDSQKSPLDTGYAMPTEGGYVLKCKIMESVEITYDEYEILLEKVCLNKMVGDSLWEISYGYTSDTEGDIPINLDVSIGGGFPETYSIYRVPTRTEPAYILYMGDAVYLYTGEEKQFFISYDTEVSYTDTSDISEGFYGTTISETFSEYLAKGGFKFGYDGEYAVQYYADVNNGIIAHLWPDYEYSNYVYKLESVQQNTSNATSASTPTPNLGQTTPIITASTTTPISTQPSTSASTDIFTTEGVDNPTNLNGIPVLPSTSSLIQEQLEEANGVDAPSHNAEEYSISSKNGPIISGLLLIILLLLII